MAFPWLARNGLAHHIVKRLYLFWPNQPNVRVDVGATLDRKLAALRAHASQIKHPERLETRIREWAASEGEAIGAGAAEAFRLVVIEEDEDEGPSLDAVEETRSAVEEGE
jgi:LmbE family N-acetylglucosaminyl deacetylase